MQVCSSIETENVCAFLVAMYIFERSVRHALFPNFVTAITFVKLIAVSHRHHTPTTVTSGSILRNRYQYQEIAGTQLLYSFKEMYKMSPL